MVEDAGDMHDAILEICNGLRAPRERRARDPQRGGSQPLLSLCEQVRFPRTPLQLPDTEGKEAARETNTPDEEVILLVATDAVLPVPDDATHRARHGIRQAHEPHDDAP